jgi:hypothetical protein
VLCNCKLLRLYHVKRVLIRSFSAMPPWLDDQGSGATAAGVWPQQQLQKHFATGLRVPLQATHADGTSCGNEEASVAGSHAAKPHAVETGQMRPLLTLHNLIYDGNLQGYHEAFREASRKENLSQLLNVLQTHDGRVRCGKLMQPCWPQQLVNSRRFRCRASL